MSDQENLKRNCKRASDQRSDRCSGKRDAYRRVVLQIIRRVLASLAYASDVDRTQKEGLIVFDFNKPKIEIAEISEDKKYGKICSRTA